MTDQPVSIATYEIVGQSGGPRLLITGGVHGDEFEPMAAIRHLITEIEAESLRGSVMLAPVVNEAAFRRGERTAEDGLDLARTCPGKADGTITERTAHALSQLIQSADYYIDLHTGGTRLAVLPLTGYTLHADEKVLDLQRRMARAFNLPIVWGTDPSLPGRSLSVARDAGVPAIYAEYMGSAVCNPNGVKVYVEGCLNVMAELEMLDRPQLQSRVELQIEDPRPSSGHLQICNPAPRDGFFQPAVRLGDRVHAGDELGKVVDETGENQETILSQQNGLVIVLRTFPFVDKGESVAVILETEREA